MFKCTIAISQNPAVDVGIKQVLALLEPFSSQKESEAIVGDNIKLKHKIFNDKSINELMPDFIQQAI